MKLFSLQIVHHNEINQMKPNKQCSFQIKIFFQNRNFTKMLKNSFNQVFFQFSFKCAKYEMESDFQPYENEKNTS